MRHHLFILLYRLWSVQSFMKLQKNKTFNRNTTCNLSDASPVEKLAKKSKSPDVTRPGDKDEEMAALILSEGVAKNINLILAKLCSLDSKMEDLSTIVKSLPSKFNLLWKLILTPLRTSRRIWMKSSRTWKLISNFFYEHIKKVNVLCTRCQD